MRKIVMKYLNFEISDQIGLYPEYGKMQREHSASAMGMSSRRSSRHLYTHWVSMSSSISHSLEYIYKFLKFGLKN